MEILDVQQGTPAWREARRDCFTASEAPAALGKSKYTTRNELLHEKCTGIVREVDAAKQSLFDRGHAAEAAAREIAEEIIGSELYPVTARATIEGMQMLASLDGLTMDETVIWEHKLWSEELAAQVRAGTLDPHYTTQLDHQIAVTKAEKALFMTSDGTREREEHCWYVPQKNALAALIAGWKQFAADLATYEPRDIKEKPQADAIMGLPTLAVQIKGEVVASNLPRFKAAAEQFIANIKTDLKTDQDFADAEETVKFCEKAEKELEVAKGAALAQTASIDELMRTVDTIREQLRRKRLDLDKLVTKRKSEIKEEIISTAREAYAKHVWALDDELKLVKIDAPRPDFIGAAKNKRTLASLHDAVDTELANAKIAADAAAKDLRAKLQWFAAHEEHAFLFRDLQTLIQKPAEDFQLAVTSRIDEHKRQEAEKEARRKAAEEAEAQRVAAAEAAKQAAAQAALAEASTKPAVAAPRAAEPLPRIASTAPTGTPTLRLGQINERLAPIALTADGLATLGFKHAATDKAAKLYHEEIFSQICAALVRHVEAAASGAEGFGFDRAA